MINQALLYVRVSSTGQEKEGYSLDAQERLGYDYAQRKNLRIVKMWKISESAWRSERDAFNQMIDYAKRHPEIGHIVFDVTDRMTRNDFDKLKIYTLIKEHGKTIHFSRSGKTLNRESGSEDEFMLDIEVAVAKKMSNDISRKSQMGMLEKAEQGIYPSVAPIGYKNNLITHLIDVDEEKAPLVKRAFSLMANGGYSLSMAVDVLNKEGLKNKAGNPIGKPSLDFALKNPIYYGVFDWKGKRYQGSHIPLVSKELFDRVQDVLSGRFHARLPRKDFPFNNLMVCGICECKVLGEQVKRRYNYYHCTFSKGRHPELSYVREERLAELFEEPVKRVTLSRAISEWLIEALQEKGKTSSSSREKRLSALHTQLKKAQDRLNRLYDMRADGEIPADVFEAKEGEYKGQAMEIQAQINGCGQAKGENWERGIKTLELSKHLHGHFLRANHHEKAKILKLLASNFTWNGENLSASYRKPFNWLAEGHSRLNWLPLLDEIHNWLLSPEIDLPPVARLIYQGKTTNPSLVIG